jgi:hypothetical protein
VIAATAWRAVQRIVTERYRRLRAAHPVSVLAWLRNSVLLCVLVTALLYVWIAMQAGDDIAAVNRTGQAIKNINNAESSAVSASVALRSVFTHEDVLLTGTGAAYIDDIDQVGKFIVLAAEDNAAGQAGTTDIRFAQDQLTTYFQLTENALVDYGVNMRFGQATETYLTSVGLPATLGTLETTEQVALAAQRGAWPLDPAAFWCALLGPVAGMLLLTAATARVLAGHFRRTVSRWLWGSLLLTAATVVTVGLFNTSDEGHLSADPWAGNPVTLTCAAALFLMAAVLAQLAYRPRLAEYRFWSA